jgi:extracellular matrix protein 14
MRSALPLLTLLIAPSLASAVYIPESCSNPSPSPFRRLTNAIIASIWPLQHAQSNSGTSRDGCSRKEGPKAADLYAEDTVLRFNISTAEEVRAIIEAADAFYLDIWEFNDNWVDIRVAKNFVSRPPYG